MKNINKLLGLATILTTIFLQGCGGGGSNNVTSPTIPNSKKNIYVLGSSTFEYMNPALTSISQEYNYNLINYAKGGEFLYSMCLRIGAFPGTVKFKNTQLINDSKNYVIADWPLDFSLKTFDVEISNIKGHMGIDQNGYYFIPNNAYNTNTEANIAYPIHSIFPKIDRNSVFIVNLGKNNLLGNDPILGSTEYVLNKSNECINWIDQNLTQNIIVVGFFTSLQPSHELIKKVNIVNTSLSEKYPTQYFDLNNYMNSNDIWQDTHISPTSADLLNQKNQVMPITLSKDAVHVNEQTNIAISKKLILFLYNKFK